MLNDRQGRIIHNVRFSVTDRCNMRCTYCMPLQPEWIDHKEILTYEEMLRLAKIFADLDVTKIRVTGGEPLVRRGVIDFIARLLKIEGLRDVSLTTNGFLLEEFAQPLRDAGLKRINVSLDSLDPERFRSITRSDAFPRVMRGLEAARRAGFDPIKINFVAVRGLNEDEVVPMIEFGRREGYEVRFIEFMPLDNSDEWGKDKVFSKRHILGVIASAHPYEATEKDPNAPADRYRFKDGRGSFGVIGSITEPFCGQCDRVRVTADGRFRTCLFSIREMDLKTPLRHGASDPELAELIRQLVLDKEPGHFVNDDGFEKPDRPMNRIGG